MAKIVTPFLKFNPSPDADVTAYKIRETADYNAEAVSVPRPAGAGEVRVPVSAIPFLAGVEGDVTVHVTATDEVDNESDFLTVTGPLDLKAPAPPTAGSIGS